MTTEGPPDFAPERKPPRLQFSLLAVFWLVTVFAIVCSLCATLAPAFRFWPVDALAALVFLFWPLPGLAIVKTCPANRFIRCVVFAFPALAAAVCSIAAPLFSLPTPLTISKLLLALRDLGIMLIVGLVFWSAQFYLIFGVVHHFRTRARKK